MMMNFVQVLQSFGDGHLAAHTQLCTALEIWTRHLMICLNLLHSTEACNFFSHYAYLFAKPWVRKMKIKLANKAAQKGCFFLIVPPCSRNILIQFLLPAVPYVRSRKISHTTVFVWLSVEKWDSHIRIEINALWLSRKSLQHQGRKHM